MPLKSWLLLACFPFIILAMPPTNQTRGKTAPEKRKSSRLQAVAEARERTLQKLRSTRMKLNSSENWGKSAEGSGSTRSGTVFSSSRQSTAPTQAQPTAERWHAESDGLPRKDEQRRHDELLALAEACTVLEALSNGGEEQDRPNTAEQQQHKVAPECGSGTAWHCPPTVPKNDDEQRGDVSGSGGGTVMTALEAAVQSQQQQQQQQSQLSRGHKRPKIGKSESAGQKNSGPSTDSEAKDGKKTESRSSNGCESPKSKNNFQKSDMEKENKDQKMVEQLNASDEKPIDRQPKAQSDEEPPKEIPQNATEFGGQNGQSQTAKAQKQTEPEQGDEQMPENAENEASGSDQHSDQQQKRSAIPEIIDLDADDEDEEMEHEQPTGADQKEKMVIELDSDDEDDEEMLDQTQTKKHQSAKDGRGKQPMAKDAEIFNLSDDDSDHGADLLIQLLDNESDGPTGDHSPKGKDAAQNLGDQQKETAIKPFKDDFLGLCNDLLELEMANGQNSSQDEEFFSQIDQRSVENEKQSAKSLRKAAGEPSNANPQNGDQLRTTENVESALVSFDKMAVSEESEGGENAKGGKRVPNSEKKVGHSSKPKLGKKDQRRVGAEGGRQRSGTMPNPADNARNSKPTGEKGANASKPKTDDVKGKLSNPMTKSKPEKSGSSNPNQNANVMPMPDEGASSKTFVGQFPVGRQHKMLLEEAVGMACTESIRAIGQSALDFGFISNEIFSLTFKANVGRLVKVISEAKDKDQFSATNVVNHLRKFGVWLINQILDEILVESAEFGAKMAKDLAQSKSDKADYRKEMHFQFFFARFYGKLSGTLKWGSLIDPAKTTNDQSNRKSIREFLEWFGILNGGLAENLEATIGQHNYQEAAKWVQSLAQMEEAVELANFGILFLLPHGTWQFVGAAERPTMAEGLFEKIGRAQIFQQIDDASCDISCIEQMVTQKWALMDHLHSEAVLKKFKEIVNEMLDEVKQCNATTTNIKNLPSKILLFLGILRRIREELDTFDDFVNIELTNFVMEKANGGQFLAKCLTFLCAAFDSFTGGVRKELGDLAKLRKGHLECGDGRADGGEAEGEEAEAGDGASTEKQPIVL